MKFALNRNKKLLLLTSLILLALVEGFLIKKEPLEFGLFLSEYDPKENKKWRWAMGRESWYYLPAGIKEVSIEMMNHRGDLATPMDVNIEIPGVFKKTYRFDPLNRYLSESISIEHANPSPRKMIIRCDSTWSPSTIKGNKDYRRLCIYTFIKLK